MVRRTLASFAVVALTLSGIRAPEEDGHDLWLRYRLVANAERLTQYRAALAHVVIPGRSATLAAARDELTRGLTGLLGARVPVDASVKSCRLIAGWNACQLGRYRRVEPRRASHRRRK